jgi:hypothetical protein
MASAKHLLEGVGSYVQTNLNFHVCHTRKQRQLFENDIGEAHISERIGGFRSPRRPAPAGGLPFDLPKYLKTYLKNVDTTLEKPELKAAE